MGRGWWAGVTATAPTVAPERVTVSASRVFHAPQAPHLPAQRGEVAPHSRHRCTVRGLAMTAP
ncbi:MAG: hypothetical protein D6683_15665 [Actinomyces sp.]|nr:MAG: hypothetical protein D6683_15665 [Actinomyces sp.]